MNFMVRGLGCPVKFGSVRRVFVCWPGNGPDVDQHHARGSLTWLNKAVFRRVKLAGYDARQGIISAPTKGVVKQIGEHPKQRYDQKVFTKAEYDARKVKLLASPVVRRSFATRDRCHRPRKRNCCPDDRAFFYHESTLK